MIVDLLVHLETEEGTLVEPETLMEAAKNAGLDGLVLTRSHELCPDLSAYQEAAQRSELKVFSGSALETNRGLILAIFPSGAELDDSILPPAGEGLMDASGVIDAVGKQGGATIALRPYDRDVTRPMGDHLFALQGLNACEVMSGRASEIANDLALEAASNLEMPCVGTSGAKGLSGLGKAATLLRRPVQNEDDLVTIIKSGDCWPIAFIDELPEEARGEPRPRTGPRSGTGVRNDDRRGGDRDRDRSGPSPRRTNERRGDRNESRESRERRSGGVDRGRSNYSGARNHRGGSGSGGRGRTAGGRNRSSVRVTSAPDHADRLPDDYGNRIRTRNQQHRQADAPPSPPDDIGNRLRPGERSPFHDVRYNDADD